MNNKTSFGSINIETGEIQDGYVENGEMKFKKQPWYKRLFTSKPKKHECLGTVIMMTGWIFSKRRHEVEIPVYRTFNPFTNKTYKIWGEYNYPVFFCPEEYDKTKRLIKQIL